VTVTVKGPIPTTSVFPRALVEHPDDIADLMGCTTMVCQSLWWCILEALLAVPEAFLTKTAE